MHFKIISTKNNAEFARSFNPCKENGEIRSIFVLSLRKHYHHHDLLMDRDLKEFADIIDLFGNRSWYSLEISGIIIMVAKEQ